MLDVLGSLKSFVVKIKTINVDNVLFKLHYQFTFILLLAFSLLVTGRQYLGDPIDCMTTDKTVRENMLDQYCWVSSTFTLPKAFDKVVGKGGQVAHHGVDKFIEGDDIIRHQYYQWVCFVLFLQAMMFYIPHYLWKIWEHGRLKGLSDDMQGAMVSEDSKRTKLAAIEAYFASCLHHHTFYVLRFCVCEVLNFVNVVGQMYLTNRFLGGAFLTYGTDVIKHSESFVMNRTDPMIKVFPRVTKCTFHTVGSSGEIQNHDALCVLPINIINEKIYIVLWFWFIMLAVLSGLMLIYRLATAFSPQVRFMILRSRANTVPRSDLEKIAYSVQFGDWFLICQLSKNINSYLFKNVIDVIIKQLENDYSPTEKHGLFKKLPL